MIKRLPNSHLAVVPIEKLRDYALNPGSDEGRHKARVFYAALGLVRDDAEWLRQAVLEKLAITPVRPGPPSRYGVKFVMEMVLERAGKQAPVRVAWFIPKGRIEPRLVSLYVLPSKAWEKRS